MKPHGILSFLSAFADSADPAARDGQTRPPAVAGSFYPISPADLTRLVDDYVAAAETPPPADIVGLVAPHAGYVYSGPVAARAYAALRGRHITRVVVIAPSHFESFAFASIYGGSGYATPLGVIPIDAEARSALAGMHGSIRVSGRGHLWSGDRGEHALEVQLPFLQRVVGEFQLVPIVMGESSYALCRALGQALALTVMNETTVLVASSDLSHYHPYDEARALDQQTLATIEQWDYLTLPRHEACGVAPIVTAMIAAESTGARQARVIAYANSGDTGGDRHSVVGYGAVAFTRTAEVHDVEPPGLGDEEKRALLGIARHAVESVVRRGPVPAPLAPPAGVLDRPAGAFVTLTSRGELRGCVGRVLPELPLARTVKEVAASAASEDQRFTPVAESELAELAVEVSVLSRLRRVPNPEDVCLGRHGILVRQGRHYGVLLPQVAAEHHLDRAGFLEACCRKAGLAPDAWHYPETDIFVFSATVFGERTHTA